MWKWLNKVRHTTGSCVFKQSRDFPQPREMRDLSHLHHHTPANVAEDLLGGTRHSLRPSTGSSESPSTSLTQKVQPYSGFVQVTSAESEVMTYKQTLQAHSRKKQLKIPHSLQQYWILMADPWRKTTAHCMEKGPQSVLQPAALPDSGQRKLKELKWVTKPQVAHTTVARTEIFMSLQRWGARIHSGLQQHRGRDEIQAWSQSGYV